MSELLRRVLGVDANETARIRWISGMLKALPSGSRLLDAGAGEQRYRPFCDHLSYVSQDFCQYDGVGDGQGLQMREWNYGHIDHVCDITAIPEPDGSFDAILCSEVFEHIADPLKALDEFARLLRLGGTLILTAPFASFVHFAPHFYATGFSRYWYDMHLARRGFEIEILEANGDWFGFLQQELARFPKMARGHYGLLGLTCFPLVALAWLGFASLRLIRRRGDSASIAAFGFHCRARRQ
jgi:SAM-dependent methyltransferase